MFRQLLAAVAFSAMAASSGCNSISAATDYEFGTPITDQQLASFAQGRSTPQDIEQLLGEPDKRGHYDGRQFMSYHYIRSPSLPFSKRKQYEQVVVFEFSKAGTLQKTHKKVIQERD